MISRCDLEHWSLRLEHAENGPGTEDQIRALLEAFASIENPVLREEIIILLEIVAQTPSLLRQRLIKANLN